MSVILVCYNRANLLRATIDSILNQTYKDFELIICDDHSTDETPHIVYEYAARDPRITFVRNSKNLGMPANLNNGLVVASGQYIANLHDGDLYDCNLIAEWKTALDRNPTAGFVFNAYASLNEAGLVERIYSEPLEACTNGREFQDRFFFARRRFDSPVWGTVMAKRAVYEELGLFDEQFGFYSDVDMWLRIASCYDVAYVPRPLISLPSRKIAPRLFKENAIDTQRTLERIFAKARRERFSQRPLRLWAEYCRHYRHVVFARSRIGIVTVVGSSRALLRRLVGQLPTER